MYDKIKIRRILIVDDMKTSHLILKTILESEPEFKVIGWAKNGQEAIELAEQLRPDVITMDLQMPVLNGFEATEHIMSSNPIPIMIVSDLVDGDNCRLTYDALDRGALAVIEKPALPGHEHFDRLKTTLIEAIHTLADVKLVTRHRNNMRPHSTPITKPSLELASSTTTQKFQLLAIGSSAGGPQTIHKILSQFDQDFPIPIVITQHITEGFIHGLAQWLNQQCKIPVSVAKHQEKLLPGNVYFSPDNAHLRIIRKQQTLHAEICRTPMVEGYKPSVNVMFESVVETCKEHAIGIILTGMGHDGATGLLQLHKTGAHTITQNEESALVYGMPGAALKLGAVDLVLPLRAMSKHLIKITRLEPAQLVIH